MPDSRRQRLDLLLVEAGLFSTREKARAAVMAGLVRKGTQILDKPGMQLSDLSQIVVLQNDCPYVSRGGLKLAKALAHFHISPQGRICLDIGASTGGFTDCLLQQGADKVYAIDSGHGQMDWKLRNDSRVVCLEKCNARYLTPEQLYGPGDEKASLAVMDVSFISLLKILPALAILLHAEGILLSLIKPQFEAAPSQNRKGIVHDPQVHYQVLENIQAGSALQGFYLHDLIVSPVLGKSGNREFLGVFYRYAPVQPISPQLFWKAIHEIPARI